MKIWLPWFEFILLNFFPEVDRYGAVIVLGGIISFEKGEAILVQSSWSIPREYIYILP
jgi:hypothetical protein